MILPPYYTPPALVQFAAYSSFRSSSFRSSYSSTRSYSSPSSSYRSTTTAPKTSTSTGYKSTTTTKPSSTGYKSTTTSKPSSPSSYKSTRPTTITKSNLNTATTPQQRTTVINNYHNDYMGYHSFFHPFGWGYGGGDFWFWMWMFDNSHYNQNQQIIQASNVNVQPHNNFWEDVAWIILGIGGIVLLIILIRALIHHLRWY